VRPSPRTVWWLNPALVFTLACTAIALPAYFLSPVVYQKYWRTSKHFDLAALLLTFACAGIFSLGSILGGSIRRVRTRGVSCLEEKSHWEDMIPWQSISRLFHASFWLCLLGYSIWIGAAIARGANLGFLWQVISGDKGALFVFQHDYLATVGGLTTLTECGIPAAIFGCMLGNHLGFAVVRRKLFIILALAMLRAFLNSERFAMIELAVPFVVVLVHLRYLAAGRVKPFARYLLRYAPVLGLIALPILFTAFEYFRSWNSYYADSGDYNLVEFGTSRLLGYYVTSFNNGALFLTKAHVLLGAPYFTLRFLWTFPGVSNLVRGIFPQLIFDSDDSFLQLLENRGVNPEFNSADGVLNPLIDFGVPGGLLYWLAIGLLCGFLYRLYKQRRPAGLCLYPFIYLGLIETPLALYWSEGKTIPAYALLMTGTLVLAVYRRRPRLNAPAPAHRTAATLRTGDAL
jgi:oligosaccharide repeat unit polymerase